MKRYSVICMVILLCLWNQRASAFWGSGSTDGASGLDVAAGFDVNTIATVAGSVIAQPERKGQEQHAEMTVVTQQGPVTVVLGPWWYWEKQNFTVMKTNEITVTGSLAQGKDGALYLFAQKVGNRSTGETITLRSESGKPFWSRGGSVTRGGNRPFDGNGSRSGSGGRGNGMRGGRQ